MSQRRLLHTGQQRAWWRMIVSFLLTCSVRCSACIAAQAVQLTTHRLAGLVPRVAHAHAVQAVQRRQQRVAAPRFVFMQLRESLRCLQPARVLLGRRRSVVRRCVSREAAWLRRRLRAAACCWCCVAVGCAASVCAMLPRQAARQHAWNARMCAVHALA